MAATQEEEEEAETQAEKVENENNAAAAAAAAAIEIENLSERGQRERECCVGGKKQTERKRGRDRERARRQAQKCRQQSFFLFLGGGSLGGLAFWDVLKPRSSASPLRPLRLSSLLCSSAASSLIHFPAVAAAAVFIAGCLFILFCLQKKLHTAFASPSPPLPLGGSGNFAHVHQIHNK